jgi:tetratricopeptide (TPR) repeat protein
MAEGDKQQNIQNDAPNQGAQGTFHGPVNFDQRQASGERSASVGGDTNESVLITGSGNRVEYTYIYTQARDRPTDPQLLDLARQLLAQMPTEALPPPRPLPPTSSMPFARNPHFVGRVPDLRAIAQAFTRSTAVAVTGLGGLGKTSVATEFVHRYGQFFAGGVFWLSFAEPNAISGEVAQCGASRYLALYADDANVSLPDQVAQVRAAWRQDVPRLLVFDNCDDNEIEQVVNEWKPASGGCRILITGRRGWWSPRSGVVAQPLHTLPRAECIALLHQHRPGLANSDADAIANELGDLPLALYLAGAYLERYYTTTPAAYLAHLRSPALLEHPSLKGTRLKQEHSPTEHDLHIGRSFALSYERLGTTDPIDAQALKLLSRAAHFAPGEPIPRDLLLATLQLAEDDNEALLDAEDGLHRLQEVGLLTIDRQDGSLTLHRLLAAFVQGIAGDEDAQAAVEITVGCYTQRINIAGVPEAFPSLTAHLRHITEAANHRGDELAAELCLNLGYYLQAIVSDYRSAYTFYGYALVIYRNLYGNYYDKVARSFLYLISIKCDLGDYKNAHLLCQETLNLCEQFLEIQHPIYLAALQWSGLILQEQGNLDTARALFEQCLNNSQGLYEDIQLSSLRNLGTISAKQGDYTSAHAFLDRALLTSQQMYGERHSKVAEILVRIAEVYYKEEKLREAELHYRKALEMNESFWGDEHPETAKNMYGLAVLLWEQSCLTDALLLLRRSLTICEKRLGEDHPVTKRYNETMVKWSG